MSVERHLTVLFIILSCLTVLTLPVDSGAAVTAKNFSVHMNGNEACGGFTTYLNIETTFDGCPIVLKAQVPNALGDTDYEFYVPHSCKTLNVQSRIYLTDQGSPTSIYLKGVQAITASDLNLFCGIDGSCDPSWTYSNDCHIEPKPECGQWAVSGETDSDSLTLTQTIDVATLHSYNDGYFNFSAEAGTKLTWYVCPPPTCCTECCQEMWNGIGRRAFNSAHFIFADISQMGSSLLKGGPDCNRNTDFEGW
jgi:hypothetical protein